MNALLNYLVEANLGLIFFYTIYQLLLSRENNFVFQRSYLLMCLLGSLIFPFFSIETSTALIPSLSQSVPSHWLPELAVSGVQSTANSGIAFHWNWIIYLYISIASALFILFILRIFNLIKLFIQSQHYNWKGYTITESDKVKGVFSFFNFIFLSPSQSLDESEKHEILRHEEVHIQKLHSLDIIIVELMGIIFWFNPLIKNYKKSLVEVHEFEADANAVIGHDVDRYCLLLAKVTLQSNGFKFANHFMNSLILKRLNMIKTIRRKINNWKVFGLMSTLPLFFFAVACNDQVLTEIKDITNESTMVDESNYKVEVSREIETLQANNPTAEYFVMELANEDSQKKIKELESQYKGHIKGLVVVEGRSYTIFEKGEKSSNLADLTISTDEVFTIVEEMASPVNGMTSFYEEIAGSLNYPEEAKKLGIEGNVFTEFVVNKDGTISNFKTLKGIGGGCDEEAIRVLSMSQQWKPAKQRGKVVRQRMVLPISFSL